MLWLQRPPLVKWAVVSLVACIALWLELRPDTMVDHPFASTDIAPGEVIGPHNTETRRLPSGVLEAPTEGEVALRHIPKGSPILGPQVGSGEAVIPDGWWAVAVPIPAGAALGDRVRLVLLDTGEMVDGVVTSASTDDPFGPVSGGVAVEAAHSAEVAVAAANGRVSVLVSTG